ncbi:MAG: FAD-binding oxidoreductase [Myxococcales bacterium]
MSLREDLASSGATVVEEANGGYRVTPPSIASLGRAVAVVRAWKQPLRVRGSSDAPVHAPPHGVLLDLGSLDRIAAVDGPTGIARVEAGCSVAALEAAARRAGCTLGPLLPSVRAGSVGAWLAGPTRGERGIPGSRRETAALNVSAVLADGRIAESRAAPRSATGPDLDHLALGGGGRLAVVAAAWIRLFPVAPALAGSWACRDLETAMAGLQRLCHDRLAPARARIVSGADSTRLAAAWEGLETAPIDLERAGRTLAELGLAPDGDQGANRWVRENAAGHPIEVDARWASLRGWSQQGELQLLGLHAGGAFATLALPEARGAEECAALARAAGARVIAPRRMRDAGPSWEAMGAGAVWKRLVEALGVEEAAS